VSIRLYQLGSTRAPEEGLRVGTVRRPPRGVPKTEFASRGFYDVWLPILSPSNELMAQAKAAATEAEWQRFARQFRKELNQGEASKVLDLLAALSHRTDFSIGCYCADETRCHRSILRHLLDERGAQMA
jgi:uncharacterized protein YeaO (DUF488 family)